jgi:hypothetical protein
MLFQYLVQKKTTKNWSMQDVKKRGLAKPAEHLKCFSIHEHHNK